MWICVSLTKLAAQYFSIQLSDMPWCQVRKKQASGREKKNRRRKKNIRRKKNRRRKKNYQASTKTTTGVARHRGSPIEGSPKTPRTFTAVCY